MKLHVVVHAKPDAVEERCEQTGENEFTISVQEPPVRGKANEAILRVLARHFNVSRYAVRLKSGFASRKKIVEINNEKSGKVSIIILLISSLAVLTIGTVIVALQKQVFESADAVTAIQAQYRDLTDYPSDALPPRAIRTEQGDDGWYVAFLQMGSEIPLLSARCFFVNAEQVVKPIGMFSVGDDTTVATVSPGTCLPLIE